MHIAKWLDIKGTNPRKFAIAIGHEPSAVRIARDALARLESA